MSLHLTNCHIVENHVSRLNYALYRLALSEELDLMFTNRLGLFVHDKSHEYHIIDTNYYDVV